jgi:hypothetical protein
MIKMYLVVVVSSAHGAVRRRVNFCFFLASAYLSRKAFDERRWATFPGIEFGWPIEYDQSEKKEWDEIFTQ